MSKIILYKKKQILIMIVAIIGGALGVLGYRYYKTGVITIIDLISALITLIMGLVILTFIVRHANKDE